MSKIKLSKNPKADLELLAYEGQPKQNKNYVTGYESMLSNLPVLNPKDEDIELVCPVCKSKNIKVEYNVSSTPFTQIDVLEGFSFKCHDCSVLFHDNSIEATCGSNICVCCIMHENKPRMMDILSPQQRRALANRLLEIDKEKGYGMMTDLSFDEFLNKSNELVRVTTKI